MNVSFTGMQNVGFFSRPVDPYKGEPYDHVDRITIQLNNKGQKDLDDFKQVLKKNPDSMDSSFLDIQFKYFSNKDNPNLPTGDVYINKRKLELNDENLPVFAKINNLLKRISKGEEKIPVAEKYIKKTSFNRFFNDIYALTSPQMRLEALNDMHDPQNVKVGAGKNSKNLVKTLNDYCMSDTKAIFSGVKSVGGVSFTTPEQKINSLSLELNDEDKAVFEQFPNYDFSGIPKDEPFLERDPRIKTTNTLNVVLTTKQDTGESMLTLNCIPIEADEKSIPVFSKLAQLMAKMSKTKEDIPFPEDYLSSKSLNNISSGFLQRGQLEELSTMSGEEMEDRGIEIDIVKSNSDAKYIAKNIFETIDKKMDAYYS